MYKEEDMKSIVSTDEDEEEHVYSDSDSELEFELKSVESEYEYDDYEEEEEEIINDSEEIIKLPKVTSWIDQITGKTVHGVEVVATKVEEEEEEDVMSYDFYAPMNYTQEEIVEEDDADVCSICFRLWTPHGDHCVCSLPCGHLFGLSCIKTWVQTSTKCPQCNTVWTLAYVRFLYTTHISIPTAEKKASTRRFPFDTLGIIAYRKFEYERFSYAMKKRREAVKLRKHVEGRKNYAE